MEFITLSKFISLLHAFCEKHEAWGMDVEFMDKHDPIYPVLKDIVIDYEKERVCINSKGLYQNANNLYQCLILSINCEPHIAHYQASVRIYSEIFNMVDHEDLFEVENEFLNINVFQS